MHGVYGVYGVCAGAAVLFPKSPIVRGALLTVGAVTLGGRVLEALTEPSRGSAVRARRRRRSTQQARERCPPA
jgi:hypothetical protein